MNTERAERPNPVLEATDHDDLRAAVTHYVDGHPHTPGTNFILAQRLRELTERLHRFQRVWSGLRRSDVELLRRALVYGDAPELGGTAALDEGAARRLGEVANVLDALMRGP